MNVKSKFIKLLHKLILNRTYNNEQLKIYSNYSVIITVHDLAVQSLILHYWMLSDNNI